MAINIDVVADTSKVVGPTAEMADGYDKVSDALKGMAKAGDGAADDLRRSLEDGGKAADKLADNADDAKDELKDLGKAGKSAGDDVERGMRDGEDAAQKLDRKADDAFDAISAGARKSGKTVKDSSKESFSAAAHASSEFADETKANISETVSSFRGDVEDIPQIMQDVLGGVSANFGVLGLAVTAGLAAGIGMAVGKLQELAEENTEAKEAVAGLAAEMYAAGGAFDDADLAGKAQEIAFSLANDDTWYKMGDQAETYVGLVESALGDAAESADTARDAFLALAGDTQAAARAQEQLEESIKADTAALEDHIAAVDNYGNIIYDKEGAALKESIANRRELQERIEEQTGVTNEATAEVEYFTEAMGANADQTVDSTKAIEDYASALDAAAGNAMSLTEAENAWTVELAASTEAVAANGKSMDINSEAGRANRETLVDLAQSANGLRDSQIAAGQSTESVTASAVAAREAFIGQAEAAGMARADAEALATSYGLVPGNVETLVAAHGTDEAKAAIDAIAVPTDAPVQVDAVGVPETQAAVDGVTGTEVQAEVTETGADATQSRINAISGKSVKVDVDDEYTVKAVQDRINGIKGKEVPVILRLDTNQFYRDLAAATQPRSMTVTVNERKGTAVI